MSDKVKIDFTLVFENRYDDCQEVNRTTWD